MTDAEAAKKKTDSFFGQIALKLHIINQRQLEEALELQHFAKERKPLGLVLIQLKYVTQQDLERILEAQKALVTKAAAEKKAERDDNLFGKVAISMGYCDERQVGEALDYQDALPRDRSMTLGEILVRKGHLSLKQVNEIRDAQMGFVMHCPQCRTPYNSVLFRPNVSLQCYRCGSPLRLPSKDVPPTETEKAVFVVDKNETPAGEEPEKAFFYTEEGAKPPPKPPAP